MVDDVIAEQSEEQVENVPEEAKVLVDDAEVRKFQSMYDRSQAELQDLKKYEPLVNLLESRPDLVQTLQDGIASPQSAQESAPGISKHEFNPCEAFTEDGSPSSQYVKNQIASMANEVVSKKMAQQQAQMQTEMHLNNTVSELRNTYKMSDTEIKGFLEFTRDFKLGIYEGFTIDLLWIYIGFTLDLLPLPWLHSGLTSTDLDLLWIFYWISVDLLLIPIGIAMHFLWNP